jgi:hypothetical protein
LSFRSAKLFVMPRFFVIPQRQAFCHAALFCHPAASQLFVMPRFFVIPQRSEGICISPGAGNRATTSYPRRAPPYST